ncbi:MAG TPA: hypothetical protein VGL54_04205 [Solirubrobacteraceae bacterium]|jgi:hypothetical protein
MHRPNLSRNRPLALLAPALCALALGGCGNTLQDQPISHTTLENLILAPFPVYWLGGSFQRMAITEASEDPSGAFTIQYGDCASGGQNTCVARLRMVTSPDNSFIPTGSQPHRAIHIRGVTGVAAQGDETIELPTAGVVVGIYADSPALARAAAETAVPINALGTPAATLPAPLPNTGFGEQPLPGQAPTLLRAPN